MAELKYADGRLPTAGDSGGEIGVKEATELLARNIGRSHPVAEPVLA